MKNTKKFLPLLFVMVLMFAVTACRNDDNNNVDGTETNNTQPVVQTTTTASVDLTEFTEDVILENPFNYLFAIAEQFGTRTNNPNPPISGGELRWGAGSTAPIVGVFLGTHQFQASDGDIRSMIFESLLYSAENFEPGNVNSLATASFDRDTRTITITKNHESFWADGTPHTLEDLEYAYYVIADPDYTGPRWAAPLTNVVGAAEYRNGEADHISGLTLSEDKMTLTIQKIDFPPTIRQFGFWSTPVPKHHIEHIPIGELEEHAFARYEVLGNGPFKIDAFVPGESVRVVRNEYYWRGHTILDAVTYEIIDPLMLPLAMREGLYDIGSPFPQSQFTEENRAQMSNISMLSNPHTGNSNFWFGFRVGDWDPELEVNVMHDEPRISVPVRHALMLSVDHFAASQLFNGLTAPMGSVYYGIRRMANIDLTLPTFNNHDPERAVEILEEAGYLMGPDGFRTRPDGSPLVITYLATTGTPANVLNRELEVQNWRDIGLNVVFYQDRLVEAAVSTDVRFSRIDEGEVDFFTFGWSFGASPNPSAIFARDTTSNQISYVSDNWDYIFERFGSDDMWDEDFANETMQLWQEAVVESNAMFPTTVSLGLTAVNNRVTNFSIELQPVGDRNDINASWNWLYMALTSDTPYVHGN